MPVEIVTIPCLADNYAFLINDPERGTTALVDVPETAPIIAELSKRGWTLSEVWLTHHHHDHVQGLADLLEDHPAKVTGASKDAHRLPPLDRGVREGESFDFAGQEVRVLDVSGHTVGHIAFHLPNTGAVFTADSLMALGCGRLFEGTAEQMWSSLSKLMDLPPETLVYSGHEYTTSNGKFALTIEPENPDLISRVEQVALDRAHDKPTVPSTLSLELATNPFLRASNPDIRKRLKMQDASDAEVFGKIRALKDSF